MSSYLRVNSTFFAAAFISGRIKTGYFQRRRRARLKTGRTETPVNRARSGSGDWHHKELKARPPRPRQMIVNLSGTGRAVDEDLHAGRHFNKDIRPPGRPANATIAIRREMP